jgi:hypothetical protein
MNVLFIGDFTDDQKTNCRDEMEIPSGPNIQINTIDAMFSLLEDLPKIDRVVVEASIWDDMIILMDTFTDPRGLVYRYGSDAAKFSSVFFSLTLGALLKMTGESSASIRYYAYAQYTGTKFVTPPNWAD